MKVEIIGAVNVANYIDLNGFSKFIITRPAQHKNGIPIFQHISGGSVDKAINAFSKWANIVDNSLPYEMSLFNSLEDSKMIGEEIRSKKGNSVEFTFALNDEKEFDRNTQNNNSNQDINLAIENALMKFQNKQNDNEILKKLTELDNRINEFDSDDEDDDSAELSGLNNPNITNLLGLLAGALKTNAPTVINGIEPDKIKNINKAVKILLKHDPELDSDLLKLANLAETNNATFNLLLNSLRTM